MTKVCFTRNPSDDSPAHRELVIHEESGTHRFFRMSGPRMQKVFAQLVDHSTIPRVLIHGNPHLANYCKTTRGAAMVDFDRSRIGPYAYDIVRFLISVSLCRQKQLPDLVHPIVVEQFKRGYITGLTSPSEDFAQMCALKDIAPKSWQTSTNAYVSAGKKWAKKLEAHEIPITRKFTKMLLGYFENRGEVEMVERYRVARCATVPGSMGKLHHLYLLQDRKNKKDSILIDIKEVYEEKDDQWYTNPFKHHGVRMNAAGELYAPGWEQRPGHTSYKDQQYWVRQIPLQQAKIKGSIDALAQSDLCYAVGMQLGRGHALAGSKSVRAQIKADFESKFQTYVGAATQMRNEVIDARSQYCNQVRKQNLLWIAH